MRCGPQDLRLSSCHLARAGTHFELANNGQPISIDANDATRPDITFDGNTPYVTWREDIGGGVTKGFSGHFTSPQKFVTDATNVPLTPTAQADVREPISSGCTANPFNADGATCQGSALGTPFFLFTNGSSPSPLGLFADAYQATPTTGGASNVTTSSATINGNVATNGAAVNVSFQFGTTTAYGGTTPAQKTGAGQPVGVLSGAHRPAGEHGDPLPGCRDERLRHDRRSGPNAQDQSPSTRRRATRRLVA